MTARIGQAGLGYWGTNLARNFDELSELVWLCEEREDRRREAEPRYPGTRFTASFADVLSDPDVNAVVIAT
ncbi:MAG TPA: hypothetical protein VK874_01975, partial [Gaiellaceae bacterium]|nr:hypothetical protein [Gaiellaceae bacterium]